MSTGARVKLSDTSKADLEEAVEQVDMIDVSQWTAYAEGRTLSADITACEPEEDYRGFVVARQRPQLLENLRPNVEDSVTEVSILTRFLPPGRSMVFIGNSGDCETMCSGDIADSAAVQLRNRLWTSPGPQGFSWSVARNTECVCTFSLTRLFCVTENRYRIVFHH
jgi:hypothetical protein